MQDPSPSSGDTASSSGSARSVPQANRQQLFTKIWSILPEQVRQSYKDRPQADKEALTFSYWQKLRQSKHSQQQQQQQQQQKVAGHASSTNGAQPNQQQSQAAQRGPSPSILNPMHGFHGTGAYPQSQQGNGNRPAYPGQNAAQTAAGRGAMQTQHHQQHQQQQQPQGSALAHLQHQNMIQAQQTSHPNASRSPAPQPAYPNAQMFSQPPQHQQPQHHQQQQQQHQHQQGMRPGTGPSQGQRTASPFQGMVPGQQGRAAGQQGGQLDRAQLVQQLQGRMTPVEVQAHADAYFQPTPQATPASGGLNLAMWQQQQQQQQQRPEMNQWQMAGLSQQQASSQALSSRPNTPGQMGQRPASGLGNASGRNQAATSSTLAASAPQVGLPSSQQMMFQAQMFPAASAGMAYNAFGQPAYAMPTTSQAPMRGQQPPVSGQATPGQPTPHQLMQQQLIQQRQQQQRDLMAQGLPAASTPAPAPTRRPTRGRGREGGSAAGKQPRKKARVEAPAGSTADGTAGTDAQAATVDATSGAMTRESLEKLLERAVAPGNKLAPTAEAALLQLVDDFLGGAVAFGCGLARRRKAGRLESADIAAYLDRTWCIRVPGFSGGAVPVARPHLPSPLHETRRVAVQEAAASTAANQAASIPLTIMP